MTPYSIVLTLHSWIRWFAIAAGFWAVASMLSPARSARGASLAGLVFTAVMDFQLLVGLALYLFISPITKAAMENMHAAMANPAWRFWTVEHPTLMLVGLVLAHVGRMVEKSRRDRAGRRALVWYALAVAALMLAAPWPFMPQGRPWVRIF